MKKCLSIERLRTLFTRVSCAYTVAEVLSSDDCVTEALGWLKHSVRYSYGCRETLYKILQYNYNKTSQESFILVFLCNFRLTTRVLPRPSHKPTPTTSLDAITHMPNYPQMEKQMDDKTNGNQEINDRIALSQQTTQSNSQVAALQQGAADRYLHVTAFPQGMPQSYSYATAPPQETPQNYWHLIGNPQGTPQNYSYAHPHETTERYLPPAAKPQGTTQSYLHVTALPQGTAKRYSHAAKQPEETPENYPHVVGHRQGTAQSYPHVTALPQGAPHACFLHGTALPQETTKSYAHFTALPKGTPQSYSHAATLPQGTPQNYPHLHVAAYSPGNTQLKLPIPTPQSTKVRKLRNIFADRLYISLTSLSSILSNC